MAINNKHIEAVASSSQGKCGCCEAQLVEKEVPVGGPTFGGKERRFVCPSGCRIVAQARRRRVGWR